MNLKDLIFPKTCVTCGKGGGFICTSCLKKVSRYKQICIECKRPAVDGKTHSKCLRKSGIDTCISAWAYEGVVQKALLCLKYKFAFEIGDELASYYSIFLRSFGILFPERVLLVPVPAHRLRKNWRGFNQSEQIGRQVAQKMDWDYGEPLLKVISRPPQTNLKAAMRTENIKGVFSLKEHSGLLLEKYEVVVVFDDVVTTGSTIKEAAKVLKRGGAHRVWGLALAQ